MPKVQKCLGDVFCILELIRDEEWVWSELLYYCHRMTAIIQRNFSLIQYSCATCRFQLDSMCYKIFFAFFLFCFFLFLSQTDPWISVVGSHPLWSAPGLGHTEGQVHSLGLSLPWEQYTTAVCARLPFGRISNACGLPAALKSLPHCSNMKKGKEHFYSVIVEKLQNFWEKDMQKSEGKHLVSEILINSLKCLDSYFIWKINQDSYRAFTSEVLLYFLLLGNTPTLRTVCTDQDADHQQVFQNAHIPPIHILLSSTELPQILKLNT